MSIETKATSTTVNRGSCRDKFISLEAGMQSALLREVLDKIRNKTNKINNQITAFVAFKKIQIASSERLQLRLLQYFEDMIAHFEWVVEVRKGVFFIHTVVNKAKMLQN